MTSNRMEKHEKQDTAFLMISNSIGKHEEHGDPFFHELRYRILREAWEVWDSCAAVFA